MKLLLTCAEESSVHGLAHLVAQNRHWAEKLLWAVILIFSIYCSYGICLTTWTRYQESPTVLTLETDYRRWMYRRPAATVCPMQVDQNQLQQMIKKCVNSGLSYRIFSIFFFTNARIWNVDEQHEKYQYYSQYLETIANATYQNLDTFEPYKNDKTLNSIDMLEVARNIKYEFIPSSEYLPVITEMGVCFSSSNLSYIQKVSDAIDYKNRTWPDSCYSFDLCKSGIKRNAYGKMRIFMYVHSEDEVMMASNIIKTEMKDSEQIEMVLWVEQIVSSSNLKHLTPARRKCVYPYETTSYYKLHTPNLCKMDCRIRKALQACDCIPYFYNIGKHLIKKSIVSNLNSIIYPKLKMASENVMPPECFENYVSFGGAAALFLGCSFLSGIEFIYFFLEYTATKCHNTQRTKRNC
ncbi:uncharacterized protein LOC109411164 [Aedes albopictus]|uniref:Pickpocket n=1 Tax=Aedes albopictus TaxID=7160 RepID=A0ABM1YHY4_AEDAL